jgi:predicted nucleic acid-binding Zn ribbon protein
MPAMIGMRDLANQLFGSSPQHVLAVIRAAWPAAVGPELARRTDVLALDGRVLRVRVPDAAWRKVLHRMRREILSRLHRSVGSLAPAALGFHEGAIAAPAAPSAQPAASEAPPFDTPDAVRRAASAIDDAELRERFVASAALYLQRHTCVKR